MTSSYYISTDHSKLDIHIIHTFLTSSYWAKNIPLATVKRSIDHSLCFGVYTASDLQVGFARIISDKTTFAYLADVFILPEFRGKGLSKRLIEEVVNHEELQGLRRMALATFDAHDLYKKFGFTALEKPEIFMEICQPTIYQDKIK